MSNIITKLFAAAAMFTPFAGAALTINNVAGNLSSALAEDLTISQLTVTGTINAADFDFINDKLTSLTSVDLSGATITAYEGDAVLSGRASFPANELPSYSFFGSKVESAILPPTVTVIETAAFGASAIKSIEIPSSVKTIQESAFAGCKNLQAINVPSTVTQLGDGVFADCTSLTDAKIYAPLTAIPARTFSGDTNLKEVLLPQTATELGNSAFINCTSLASLAIPSGVKQIGDKAFYNSGLTSIDLTANKGLTSIGDYAFAMCTSLTKATLPNTGLTLGQGLFFDDSSLRTVTLPESTTEIPSFTFKGTSSISSSTAIPAAVVKIGDYALMGWDRVDEFLLPSSLSSIGTGAMENWTSLKTLDGSKLKAVPETGEEVWAGITPEDVVLYVDGDTYNDFTSTPQWNEFQVKIKTSSSEPEITIDNKGEKAVTFDVLPASVIARSTGEPIASASVYDMDGRRRIVRQCNAQTIEIAVDRLPAGVFIVNVVLTDGTVANIKINKQ